MNNRKGLIKIGGRAWQRRSTMLVQERKDTDAE